ncbi:hypothetical protein U3653_23055 [Nocardia sp. CDC186]|uniref:Plasmid mobilization relaxosome protein MobC n=1 Tax=Nocardia implantans TaxID=3108168 RepID=A0ABU6B0L3_9NOCA|nr:MULTISPECIES: hypothetical protein [unclassified Nocardia]MEA3532987.1 hypothetical protein [Nocardia sp. CDC192]MEB3512919.1 hypothetical protein [Nocardia sp. CDC186]
MVKLSDAEQAELTARAEAAGMSVPRLLVETTLGGQSTEVGRAHAALRVLELDDQVRGAMNNLNQLVRYSHQNRELAEGIAVAVVAATRASLQLDALARWVMGLAPAVSSVSIAEEDLDVDNEWAAADLDG